MSKLNARKRVPARPTKRMAKAEGMSRDALSMFQPWFLPNKISRAVRQLLPPEYANKMTDYFLEYGCIRCDKKDTPYGGNGFCKTCREKLQNRLRGCVMRMARKKTVSGYGLKFLSDAHEARRLLRGFPCKMYVTAQSRAHRRYTNNPAREAFIVMNSNTPRE